MITVKKKFDGANILYHAVQYSSFAEVLNTLMVASATEELKF